MRDSQLLRHRLHAVLALPLVLGLGACDGAAPPPTPAKPTLPATVAEAAPPAPARPPTPAPPPYVSPYPARSGQDPFDPDGLEEEGCPSGDWCGPPAAAEKFRARIATDELGCPTRLQGAAQPLSPPDKTFKGLSQNPMMQGRLRKIATADQRKATGNDTLCCYHWFDYCSGRPLLDEHDAGVRAPLQPGRAWLLAPVPGTSQPVLGTSQPVPGTSLFQHVPGTSPADTPLTPVPRTSQPVPGTSLAGASQPVPGTSLAQPVPGTSQPVPGTSLAVLPPTARQHLATLWQADAQDEHASVAAFARATLELLAVGAPPELVAASQRASLDEIRHARVCLTLAARYAAPQQPGPLPALAPRGGGLVALACDTFLEGCVGETIAALAARRAARHCIDTTMQDALVAIAEDETRHAELAWSTVAWAVQTGGSAVAEALRALAHDIEAQPTNPRVDTLDLATLAAHGRLSSAGLTAARQDAWSDIIAPTLALLLA